MLVRTRKTVPSVLGYCHLSGAFRALTSEGGKVKGKGSLRVRGDGGWILTLVVFRLQFLLIIISRQKKTPHKSVCLAPKLRERLQRAGAGWESHSEYQCGARSRAWAKDSETLGAQTEHVSTWPI